MEIGKLQSRLNEWQFSLKVAARSPNRLGFHPFISFWLIKLHQIPAPGEMITSKYYRGVHFTIRIPMIYAELKYRTSLAQILKWDRKPIPRWMPEWVLMREGAPRPGLIKILSKKFDIPLKIKLI